MSSARSHWGRRRFAMAAASLLGSAWIVATMRRTRRRHCSARKPATYLASDGTSCKCKVALCLLAFLWDLRFAEQQRLHKGIIKNFCDLSALLDAFFFHGFACLHVDRGDLPCQCFGSH